MKQQKVAEQIEKLLEKLALPKPVTVEDIKDIIWNAQKNSGSTSLFSLLSPYAKDETTLQEIMQLMQDAWNYFPHRMLGGKSPYDLMQEYEKTGKIDQTKQTPLPKKGKSAPDISEDRYPKTVVFASISDDSWGWGFPKEYHELTEELWELEESQPSTEIFEKELHHMIKRAPMLFDAVNKLAHVYGLRREFGLTKTLYEQTIKTARTYIPKTFLLGTDRVIWAYIENRPFLRLLAGYIMFVEQFESVEKAIPLYEEILAFNPNDNQGIRGYLTTAYLKTNQPERVIELASHYPEGGMAELNVGTLLAYLMLKNEKQAKIVLKDIKKWHANVIKELLKPTHHKPSNMHEDHIAMGGTDEAFLYWQDQGVLWEETAGAITFLEENAKEIKAQIITFTDKDVLAIPIFQDFLAYLTYLKKQPIKRTATGNISIKAVIPFLKTLQTMQPIFENVKKYRWKIRTEDEAQPLHRLNVISDIMKLTRTKHDKILITKNGLAYLQNLSPIDQYRQLVEHYWQRVNWQHFTALGWVRDDKIAICETLQRQQNRIWDILAANGTAWIDYEAFCHILRDELQLLPLVRKDDNRPDETIDAYIHHILFTDNLSLFHCVEVEMKAGKYEGDRDITRFRSTKLGLAMYTL
ncbi:MAG: hypothetical protein ACREHC_06505 [Candidatus Levyibacteriota bacterium]